MKWIETVVMAVFRRGIGEYYNFAHLGRSEGSPTVA